MQQPQRRIKDRVAKIGSCQQQQASRGGRLTVNRGADPARQGQVQQHRGAEHLLAAVAVECGAIGRVVEQQE